MTRFVLLSGFGDSRQHYSGNLLIRTYQATSSATVDELWRKITNLADVSWHPILASTNVPHGLVVKPGLIYQAFTRLIPIPIQIFVERVSPRELFSIRILVLPGLEEKVTYQVRSAVCGTCVSYSVTLKGWLSPVVWSLMRPCAARVALKLVQAVEQPLPEQAKSAKLGYVDFWAD